VAMRELILSLKKDHLVILSSHILSEIEEVCDHVLIISKGKLVLSDNTEHLLEEHDESLEDVFLELTEDEQEENTKESEPLSSRFEDEEGSEEEAEDENIDELTDDSDEEERSDDTDDDDYDDDDEEDDE
ncbi:MAG: hypothetical protein II177_06305, partial [Lachnospiraceae bacterium]|nr:hypothetical protein [Lachnospiraceae bacterium]